VDDQYGVRMADTATPPEVTIVPLAASLTRPPWRRASLY
jgi:hypothetical protein